MKSGKKGEKIMDKEEFFICIVDALAEQNELLKKANKLKRLELELKLYEGEIKTTIENQEKFDKDLQDCAP